MVKSDQRIVAEILIFQIDNFDNFLVKNDYSLVALLTIRLVIYSLPLGIVFDLSLVAKILIFNSSILTIL